METHKRIDWHLPPKMTDERLKELSRVAYFLHKGTMNPRAGGNSLNEALSEIDRLKPFEHQFYLTRNMLAAIVTTFEETGVNFPFPELFSEAKRVLKEVDGE